MSTKVEDLEVHGASPWSYHPAAPPLAIIYPASVEDVVDVVRICSHTRTPIVPYAGGTSLEAHAALQGAVCVDWRDMASVISVNAEDGDVHVQPGLRYEDLNAHLKSLGLQLFFPVDPGPGAQIGGMCASGGSGTNAVRYGTMKGDYVLSLDVVLASGEVIRTRSRARKSSAGPDLTKLFLGSEGTLGLIVGATLRLAPLLPISVACVPFPSVENAVSAAHALLNTGANVQCVELLDEAMIRAINADDDDDDDDDEQQAAAAPHHPLEPTLFVKFAGTDAHRTEDERLLSIVASSYGANRGAVRFARKEAEMEELWSARKQALWAALEFAGEGKRCWTTDVCVPISKLPQLVKRVKQETNDAGIYGPIVGHV
ncbi:FAD-binding domain-containing protein [Ceraceosorus guamensis]|uniref:D-lactate dehydrogenase (cytochrome) n=1 Tax=Ceraceosorus guamensis TaxID=1522189 RepID=A0A316VNP5_9BASI|nr:FAD-binding domain-containing protein [Ceraceosorus guamensis]PWN38934.1 FAD-binding domain-containing protein [Ceraceosorus guamensis]